MKLYSARKTFPRLSDAILAHPFISLGVLTVLRLILATCLPVTPDEAYYWTWSHDLQASYLDHPPMVAWWIWIGTALFGDTGFGIRFTAPLATALGTILTVLACRDFQVALLRDRPLAPVINPWIVGVLLNATLALGVGATVMTPDTPLLFFMALFLWASGRLVRTGDLRWWLLLGVSAGLGFDSKYTMVLPVAGLGLWCLLSLRRLKQLLTVWPWLGAVIGVCLTFPVVWWNATHGWASFIRQGGRTGDWQPSRAPGYLGELIGGQIGLLTPGIFLLSVVALIAAFRRRSDVDRLLLCLTCVPAAVFLQHALGDRVQANWPVLIYPALVCLIVMQGDRRWKIAAGLGYALWGLLLCQATTGFLPLNRHFDVALRQGGGWTIFAENVAQQSEGAAFIASDEYALASELAFHLPGRIVLGAEPRWMLFDLPAWSCKEGWGLLIRNGRRSFPQGSPWAALGKPAGMIVRSRDGREAERYNLYRVACPIPALPASWLRKLPAASHS
ncbi:glycosyl/arabinosyl/mannosyl transferase [Acetobacter aceti NRIC 0242]|uniref:Glycosyl transferase n=1 Tax=Acetobacter aceti NBRC 14818 TaxID=887700 RepID=A0AB33IEB5_ACEAC|nr:glycosyltransferase family 39 protein [Acetobacter aceti]TCS34095.1 dolichyl-phosphate-mannose-protein mannosyltransferase [Acetobacter aceti NBRC 14818]BCK75618.1 glycosyl transferase [Acetobacter aceti NBRC 14818]GAN56619.1 glycosyl/arabinosyl/mannosyl transferase [Acetobacter aceti NBRC 14818]GBO79866.1 glycosyl/arabinosyl/mannosyl transferase [Acetobacter aceti NRIC 0242]